MTLNISAVFGQLVQELETLASLRERSPQTCFFRSSTPEFRPIPRSRYGPRGLVIASEVTAQGVAQERIDSSSSVAVGGRCDLRLGDNPARDPVAQLADDFIVRARRFKPAARHAAENDPN